MRLPRDLSGRELAKLLEKLGYRATRQKGSHVRLTTTQHFRYEIISVISSLFRLNAVE